MGSVVRMFATRERIEGRDVVLVHADASEECFRYPAEDVISEVSCGPAPGHGRKSAGVLQFATSSGGRRRLE
jgi:hypothetical protein